MNGMTHKDIISLWPSAAVLAADLNVKPAAVHKWRERDSIPASFWMSVVKAGKSNGYCVSLEHLARAAERAA